jgi:hypothetical protein
MNNKTNKLFLTLMCVSLTQLLFSQVNIGTSKITTNSELKVKNDDGAPKKDYSKWSADLNLGLPYMFSPIGYNLTGMGGIGVKYSFSPKISLGLQYDLAFFSGENSSANTVLNGTNANPKNIKDYSTFATTIGFDCRLNLRNLIFGEPENLKKWNHYYVFGFGFMSYRNDNNIVGGGTSKLDYPLFEGKGAATIGTRYYRGGYEVRNHLNNKIDLLGSVSFNFVESYWIDGAGEEKNYRNQLMAKIGVSYKFGIKGNKELIDWAYSNYSYSKEAKEVAIENIPVIDKPKVVDVPKVEPKVEPAVVPVIEPVVVPEPVKPVIEPVVPKVEPIVVPVPEPVVPKVEPVVVPVPEPVKPKVEPVVVPVPEPVKPKVEPVVVPVPEPVKPKVEPAVVTVPVVAENKEEVTEPDNMYNVVVACYGLKHLDLAIKYRDSIRKKGFKANVYRSIGSKLYRVMTTSSDDEGSALKILKQSKVEIDPQSWFYLYNKQ